MAPARSETVDRYLETIYYIEHEGEVARPGRIAEWMGVSAPTVTNTLRRLERDGWVVIAPDRSVRLSDAGEHAASQIVRRHRLVERWLTDVLGLDWITADREAGAIAHGLSEVVMERLDGHLGEPLTCPHGNVIPGRRPPRGGRMVRLLDVEPGAHTRLLRVSEVAEHEAPHVLGVLHDTGLVPEAALRLVAVGREWVELEVAGARHRIEPAVARAIWVEAPSAG